MVEEEGYSIPDGVISELLMIPDCLYAPPDDEISSLSDHLLATILCIARESHSLSVHSSDLYITYVLSLSPSIKHLTQCESPLLQQARQIVQTNFYC